MKYTIQQSPTSNGHTIFLHQNDLGKFNLEEGNLKTVNIGAIQYTVLISGHQEQELSILMSLDLYEECLLPPDLNYEVKVIEGDLYIGPVIGMLIRGKWEELTQQRIKIYKSYLIDYSHVNGLVVLFTSDGIDPDRKTIKGYSYSPKDHEWIPGLYPFPSVVFTRKTVKKKGRQQLNQLIGSNYFNSHVFNKWEMWEWFSSDKEVKNYLAETVLVNNEVGVKKLLEEHKEIYIKPISGMQGTGIYQLSTKEDHYFLTYRMSGKNMTTVFESWEAVVTFLGMESNIDKYIAQRKIRLLKISDRVVDFRVIVIKDKAGKWTVPGMVSKLGEKNSIVSNISSGGTAEKVWSSLQKIYKGDPKEAFKKYREIQELAITCCKKIESRGLHLAYIGIDIGIDELKNLWVIEINNRSPDMTIALDAEDPQLYYRIKAAPLHYAKWVAGFGVEQNAL